MLILCLFEHPETKVGSTGFGKGFKSDLSESDKSPADRFTAETAKVIGKGETFVKEHLQLNEKLIPRFINHFSYCLLY